LVGARDVAPTVLHLAGLPVSRELEGQALLAALTPAFRARHPLRHVGTYGQRRSAAPAESNFDRQMIEELRSLGYVQ
jgi:arylsulfatase A-like enzyme